MQGRAASLAGGSLQRRLGQVVGTAKGKGFLLQPQVRLRIAVPCTLPDPVPEAAPRRRAPMPSETAWSSGVLPGLPSTPAGVQIRSCHCSGAERDRRARVDSWQAAEANGRRAAGGASAPVGVKTCRHRECMAGSPGRWAAPAAAAHLAGLRVPEQSVERIPPARIGVGGQTHDVLPCSASSKSATGARGASCGCALAPVLLLLGRQPCYGAQGHVSRYRRSRPQKVAAQHKATRSRQPHLSVASWR